MLTAILVCLVASVVVDSHIINEPRINKLEKQLKEYQAEQDDIYKKLDAMETSITARIQELASGQGQARSLPKGSVSGSTSVQFGSGPINFGMYEQQLTDLENQLDAIMTYLTTEKKTDIVLKRESDKVIEAMEGKVKEAADVIDGLKETVASSLDNFENMIHEVNKSAHVIINSKGVIFYGGVGSACSYNSDDCLVDSTECRSKKCQCLPGLSYDMSERKCVESCDFYGATYQSVDNYIIRGYNNLTMEEVDSIEDCKTRCNEETEFKCLTIDYFPRWKRCYLSESSKQDVPEEAYEYNSAGIHFQRDCE